MTEIIALEKLFHDEKRTVLTALQSGAMIVYPPTRFMVWASMPTMPKPYRAYST
jgi:hypothetical protein